MPGKHSTSELLTRVSLLCEKKLMAWGKDTYKNPYSPSSACCQDCGSGVDGALCWTHAGGMAEAVHPGLDVWLMWLLEENLYLPACKMVFLSPSLWTFDLKYHSH